MGERTDSGSVLSRISSPEEVKKSENNESRLSQVIETPAKTLVEEPINEHTERGIQKLQYSPEREQGTAFPGRQEDYKKMYENLKADCVSYMH